MNIKRLFALVLFICVAAVSGNGQPFQKIENGIKSEINSVGVEIQFFSPSIVRVLKWPAGEKFTKNSFSVVKSPEKSDLTLRQTGDVLTIKSKSLMVILNLNNGKVSFSNTSGKPLLTE